MTSPSRFLALLLLIPALSASAHGQSFPPGLSPPKAPAPPRFFDSRDEVDVSVAVDRATVAAGGQVTLAVLLEHHAGWHVHTHDPQVPPELGDPGDYIATVIAVETPATVTAHTGWIQWPEPHEITVAFGGTPVPYTVYSGRAIAWVPLTVGAEAPPGPTRLRVLVTYQACDDRSCLAPVYEQPFDLTLFISPLGAAPPSVPDPGVFTGFDASVYDDIYAGKRSTGTIDFDLFGLSFTLDPHGGYGFASMLLLAALGGLLLNFTPCVLPVIPIKIMGLSASAGSRGATMALGTAMAAGVVLFWIALGAAISGISTFTSTSELFQYPVFTIGTGIVIAAMAVGMCSVFTLRLPGPVLAISPRHDTLGGSLLFGIMTAVLSTPCTAPFMGAAAAWAAMQSSTATLATFTAIGAGMASPYLLLSAFPRLIERMPRTGPASDLVKQTMGLLMLAAAAYFIGTGISALLVQPGEPVSRLSWWFVAAAGAAGGGWLGWRTLRITRSPIRRLVFGGLGAAILSFSVFLGISLTGKGPIDWVYYTPDRFSQARSEARIVVMDFTAEWCLNCKVLEETVLRSEAVVRELHADDVVPIKVDITNNPAGKAMLNEVGRITIPLLVIFDARGEEVFKSDAYTPQQVLDAIDRARDSERARPGTSSAR